MKSTATMKLSTRIVAFVLSTLAVHPCAWANSIDFSLLDGAQLHDIDGQDFSWTMGSENGSVNIRSDWNHIAARDGFMHIQTPTGATLATPFTGTVEFTFDRPVQLTIAPSVGGLQRDEIDDGRFERIQLSSSQEVTFSPLADTTATYMGAGTNSISADDDLIPLSQIATWGFVAKGASSQYILTYTSSRVGFGEVLDVRIVPEPAWLGTIVCVSLGLGIGCWRRRLGIPTAHSV